MYNVSFSSCMKVSYVEKKGKYINIKYKMKNKEAMHAGFF